MGKFRLRRNRKHSVHKERGDKIPLKTVAPNMITALAVCAGITSISLASEGRWENAMWALFTACICDAFDGRVARLLNASSKLGAELDSLADFVNFGVAPALFMFYWVTGLPATHGHGCWSIRFVLACALFYAVCDAFRLARFNTMLEEPKEPYWKNYFLGIPAPGGCWMVLTPVLLWHTLDKEMHILDLSFLRHPAAGAAMLLLVGFLMASRLPTISFKSIHVERKKLPLFMLFVLLLAALLATNFWLTFGVIGTGYVLSVPLVCMRFAHTKAKYLRQNPPKALAA
jgi:CDP-diacylglycerol--serine O-phosphatidyltransferase